MSHEIIFSTKTKVCKNDMLDREQIEQYFLFMGQFNSK